MKFSLTNNGFNTEDFEVKIQEFSLRLQNINTQQDIICSLSESIIDVRDNPVILQLYMRVIEEYSCRAPPEHLIPLVYILNDFAQKSKPQAHFVSEALLNIFSQINLYYTEYMAKARRCFNIWKNREIFDHETLKRLDCSLLGINPPVPTTISPKNITNNFIGIRNEENSITYTKTHYNEGNRDEDVNLNQCMDSERFNSQKTVDGSKNSLKERYLDLCSSYDKVIRDISSAREKRKIIQNILITNEPIKKKNDDRLFKLLEMEWELRCQICEGLKATLDKVDIFHTEITRKLANSI
ncbi:hypothetical protein FG386_000003 [Cryptosporidium ryanae]|uniref:uncharacterized protein n=1 Tax=Cryptosporidium ryanae TaxID=515981 RepID=UPI003519E733|nr:hypothetical protein FG386_000003 [Cryptosporidium ryanae]